MLYNRQLNLNKAARNPSSKYAFVKPIASLSCVCMNYEGCGTADRKITDVIVMYHRCIASRNVITDVKLDDSDLFIEMEQFFEFVI